MDPSNTFHRPRDNIPFSPNDYWDRSRFVDPNPTQSLASLPSHIQSPGPEEPRSESGLKPWPAAMAAAITKPETRPSSQNARLTVQDARGRTTDRSYAQQLKMRSRSPQFVPYERSVSGSRSVVASPSPSPRPSVDEKRPGMARAGSDRSVATTRRWYNGQSEWAQRSEGKAETETETDIKDQGQDQSTGKDPDEVVMSSTAYPGQEWTPAGLHGLEYF